MKVIVLAAQAPFPPRDGGTERSAAIFSVIATNVPVRVFWPTEQPFDSLAEIANGIEQFAVSLNPFSILIMRIFRKALGNGSWGPSFALSNLILLRLRKRIEAQMCEEDVLILDQPWLIKALPKNPKFKVVLNAHNAETEVIRATSKRKRILNKFITNLESETLKIVDSVLYCTEADFCFLKQHHPSKKLTGVHLPNGVFRQEKNTLHRENNSFIFVGSAHEPNITAAKALVRVANLMPDIEIYLAGDVCSHIGQTPANIKLMGRVTEENLQLLLSSCSAFLNPVTEGSGMHLKIARAIASEIPIITTEFGARGFHLENNKSVIFSEVDRFDAAIRQFLTLENKKHEIAKQALKSTEGMLFWEDLVDTSKIIGRNVPKQKSLIQKSLKGAIDLEYFVQGKRTFFSSVFLASRKIRDRYRDL